MQYLLTNLVETAVEKEVRKLLNRGDQNWVQLAQTHSVKMLDEIGKILDDRRLTPDEALQKILKIICFCPVPPHTSND